VPYFDLQMGLTRARADYLGTLAVSTTRRGAPPGYWSGGRCRDGGARDLYPRAEPSRLGWITTAAAATGFSRDPVDRLTDCERVERPPPEQQR
jgi:hypothetical protein